MSQLIDKFKKDHVGLVAALQEIRKLGITNPEAVRKLTLAKAALLAHLKHEDTDLYPALKKAAQTNPKVKSTLDVLMKDMEGVAKAALEFFDKYEKGGSPTEFARDFSRLQAVLATRIRREEETLYPMFDSVVGNKAA